MVREVEDDVALGNSDVDINVEEEDEKNEKKVPVLRKVYERRYGSSSPVYGKVETMVRPSVEEEEDIEDGISTAGGTSSTPSPVRSTPKYRRPRPSLLSRSPPLSTSPHSSPCKECEIKTARIASLDSALNDLNLEKANLQNELTTCRTKLREVSTQKENEEIGYEEELMESKTVVQRQQEQIAKLSTNLEKREVDYFSAMEELAESKSILKEQQRRVEELFGELNSEKRSKDQTEGWLMELRDQCLKLKELVEERAGLKDTVTMLNETIREEKRVRSVLQQNYNKLWEINRELESGESVELSATRSQWHRASQRNQQLERQLASLMRHNTSLQQQVAMAENCRGGKVSFSEALSGILSEGIDKASHIHIETLTSDLSLINKRIAERIAHGLEVKKLMANLHPDRTPIPACKETLQARFQLLNHIRTVLG